MNFHDLDVEVLIKALISIVVIFAGAIWYVIRKEKEAKNKKLRYSPKFRIIETF